ncbi:MAG: sugar ABC transporter substrate-binding protein [Acetivibrionales bacterium]|jgi:ribose transport system substrate-binding protein
MRKILLKVVCVFMVMVLLAGCGTGKSGEGQQNNQQQTQGDTRKASESNPLEGKRIAVIVKGLTQSYWQNAKKGAEVAAKDFGIEMDILAPVETNNNEQQIQLVQEAIAKKYDVICLSPCDSTGIVPAVEEANEAGIPIVNFATIIKGGKTETYIAIENYDAQYKVTKATCELIKEGKVIILEGPAGQQNAMDKTRGAEDAIKEFPGIEIVASQVANWSRTEGFTVTQNLLQAHPDLKGVIACNDDMAMGALQAIDEIGKAGEIYLCGMDCIPDALQAIREGKMHVDIDNMPYELAYSAVEAAVKILKGEEVEKVQILDAIIVTKDNVEEIAKKKEV